MINLCFCPKQLYDCFFCFKLICNPLVCLLFHCVCQTNLLLFSTSLKWLMTTSGHHPGSSRGWGSGVSYPGSHNVWGPTIAQIIKCTRMYHFKKKMQIPPAPEGPRKNVSLGLAVALDGRSITNVANVQL